MAIDLTKIATNEPVPFTVDFNGDTYKFYVKQACLNDSLKKSGQGGAAAGKRLLIDRLLDEDMEPVTKEWVDQLYTLEGLEVFALKIQRGITTALGLDDLAGKNG